MRSKPVPIPAISLAAAVLMLLAISFLGALADAPADPALPTPLAHWSFDTIGKDRTVEDITGNGHTGEIVRSERLTGRGTPELHEGIRGKALSCGGSQQYGSFLSIADPPELDGPFTLTLWMRPSGGQWITRPFYFKHNWLSREGFELQLSSTNLALVLCPPKAQKDTRHWLRADRPVHVKCWSFVTVRWDGADWALFLNGRCVAREQNGEFPYKKVTRDLPMILGGYSLNTNNVFCGLIDETRLFGTALTDDQIRRIMIDDLESD